jgi:alanyl-tRNA synthetase
MNQFKPIFLGQVDPASPLAKITRAVNSQKCIRAGGKHNDLDDVGKDTYHHTFFEMLGNWSFGDYFKPEAIEWAWELLTDVWGLDPERLYASYFEGSKEFGLDPDREAYDLWTRYLPASRIIPGNMKDNFWEMGDTGPCGPCSEIHYDGRSDAERARVPGYELVNRESPDVVEVWNLVFIQFNRTGPTSLEPLPAKHVDTGMGLERVVRFLQGKDSNYDTDIFTPLFDKIHEITGARVYSGGRSLGDPIDTAYRVIADHARTLTIAITDGAEPSNEGRGYVLRRILRRAVRFGRQTLGADGPFMGGLVPAVVESLAGTFPELRDNPQRVIDILTDEEESFGRTLDHGLKLFEQAADRAVKKDGEGHLDIAAEDAFQLHDTFGFPIDLTQLMAEERGLTVDTRGFGRLMEEARERSRGGAADAQDTLRALPASAVASLKRLNTRHTDDSAKHTDERVRGRLLAIWNGTDFDENLVASNVRADRRFALIFDRTCFYAEAGGQVADTGRVTLLTPAPTGSRSAKGGEFHVEDVHTSAGYVIHVGRMRSGELRVSDTCDLRPDAARRLDTAANHTATHLLNLALRTTLGDHVDQKGSLVAPDRLRFDFSHSAAITDEQLGAISDAVAADIDADLPVHAEVTGLDAARKINTLRAVFGETYPDPVRVVSIGPTVAELLADPASDAWMARSVEFCGGTHLPSTGRAEAFAVVAEESVSKGVRRVVALTRGPARRAIAAGAALRERARGASSLPPRHLPTEVKEIQAELEAAEIPLGDKSAIRRFLDGLHETLKGQAKQAAKAGREQAVEAARAIASEQGPPAIVAEIPAGGDRQAILAAMDVLTARHADAAVLLASADTEADKIAIVAKVPESIVGRGLKAGDWVRRASQAAGGKGGGKPDSAQGGGLGAANLPAVLEAAGAFASETLG